MAVVEVGTHLEVAIIIFSICLWFSVASYGKRK